MAKFRLAKGEQVIERAAIVDPKHMYAFQTLMLTSQRVVVLRNEPMKLGWFSDMILSRFTKLLREDRVEAQISRTQLASVDADGKRLAICSSGDLYVTKIVLELEHAERWAAVLRGWAAGDEATEIATATVVKRD
jgi:hypothetical protein